MTWSKEEIMAYVDGQLPESEILRIENAINQDINAKNYYENLVEASDLINISYTQLEKSYVGRSKSSQVSNPQKNNQKNVHSSNFASSIAIQYKGLLGAALLAIALIFGAYQAGKNSQNALERNQADEMFAINNILKNKDLIQDHIKRNNLKDIQINFDNEVSAVIKFKERTFDEEKFCQKFVVQFKDSEYNVDTCNKVSNIKKGINRWDYQFR